MRSPQAKTRKIYGNFKRNYRALITPKDQSHGYSLPLVIAAALILIAGTAVFADRAGMGLLSSIFQNQSWEAKEAAEIGMTQIVSELNKETNRYLMVKRPGDNNGIWTTSSNPFVEATRTNPCTGATPPSYAKLDSRTVPATATATTSATSYGIWYIQATGEITSTKGNAVRGFRLTSVTRQEINSSGSPLNIYQNRPTGTGQLTLQVQGLVFRGSTEVASAELEKVFELVPKCCKVSFGAAHGGLDYGINNLTKESICLNSAASLGLGLVAGAGIEGGSMSLIGNTSVKDTNQANISPVICIVTPTDSCSTFTNGNVTTQIANVDITLPSVKTYQQAYATATTKTPGPGAAEFTGILEKCTASRDNDQGNKININTCKSNPIPKETNTSERLTNFTYCADGLQAVNDCNYTVINGDVSIEKLPNYCAISAKNELHCNIKQFKYDRMIFATGTRPIILYFPYSDTGNTQNDQVITDEGGNSWFKNCPVSSASLQTGDSAINCTSATGDQITRVSMFGCAPNTCLPSNSSSTQTVSLKGGTAGVGIFTYFPEGTMRLNGTPTYEGVMWGKIIDAGGNVRFVIPAAGLTAALNFMGAIRDNENTGFGNGQIPSYDFIARATNRYRWI
jgi:hypothetical protein